MSEQPLPIRFVAAKHHDFNLWHIHDMLVAPDGCEPPIWAVCTTEHDANVVTDALTEYFANRPHRQPAPSVQTNVVMDVIAERLRQDAKWGVQDHTPMEWLAIESEELGEVAQELLRAHFGGKPLDDYRTEFIQVAAVAVAAVENLDRQRAATSSTPKPPAPKPEIR